MSKKKTARQRLRGKKAFNVRLPMCMDHELVQALQVKKEQHTALESELEAARRTSQRSRASQIQAEISESDADVAELEEAVAEATITFVFRAIPGSSYDKLLKENRPTAEQKQALTDLAEEEGKPLAAVAKIKYDTDRFPAALVAATLTSPEMTTEEVLEEIWTDDAWNQTEKAALFEAAKTVQSGLSLPR